MSGSKLRPAVVLANAGREDYIACQVTSHRQADGRAIELQTPSFSRGGLNVVSFARPGKLFTAHRSIIARRVGTLSAVVFDEIKTKVIDLIRTGT